MDCDYLVIGGGVAGVTAAETIRRNDPQGSIILVSDEDEPLYNRILLPYFIKGEKTIEQLYLRKREEYDRNNITVRWGKRVVAGKHNSATLDDGETIAFKKAVLAYSGDLRKLPGNGLVHYLRTIADAKRIKQAIEQAVKPIVVGDSFIALEFLGVLITQKRPGTAVIAGDHFFAGRVSPASSQVLEDYLTDHKISIIRNTKISEALGEQGRFSALKTEAGKQLEGDFCGAGVGLVFNSELAKQLGAPVKKGVLTDVYLKSTDNIWSAGDIAEFDDEMLGTRHMLGNWVHAMESGRIAGNNASGEPKPYQTISAYSTQTLGIPIAMAGDTGANPANQTVVEQIPGGIAEIFVRDNRTVGAVMINMPTLIGRVLMAIRGRKPWPKAA